MEPPSHLHASGLILGLENAYARRPPHHRAPNRPFNPHSVDFANAETFFPVFSLTFPSKKGVGWARTRLISCLWLLYFYVPRFLLTVLNLPFSGDTLLFWLVRVSPKKMFIRSPEAGRFIDIKFSVSIMDFTRLYYHVVHCSYWEMSTHPKKWLGLRLNKVFLVS